MINLSMLAETAVGVTESAARTMTYFAKLRLYSEEPWFYPTVTIASLAVLVFVVYMYRRDSVELRPGLGWLLLTLRVLAFVAILLFFLKPEQRTEREVVHNSRVLLLVDTSQSMGLHDSDATAVPAAPSRIDQVVSRFADGELLKELRKVHDVSVLRFDQNMSRIVTLPKLVPNADGQELAANATPIVPDESQDKAKDSEDKEGEDGEKEEDPAEQIDWKQALVPQGPETRLGSALKRLVDEERNSPISAIVLLTDGGQNSGVDPQAGAEAAKEANIPIFTVGLGSSKRQLNVRVSDLIAPARAYPEDSFTVTGYLQGQGMADRTVTVELYSRDASEKDGVGMLEDSQRVALGPDNEVIPVKFELKPDDTGRRTYHVRVKPPADDHNPSDDFQEADVEIVDRKNHVLLFASGATREYRFVRNQLKRDENVIVDVYLQNARPGISQDANEILDDFPVTKEELYKYDAIVAFDPDWESLNEEQIDLVEKWVAEEAGGMIAVAGPVFMDTWVSSTRMSKIRNLYPVEFHRRISLSSGEYDAEMAWPLHFTHEGSDAEFLWLGDLESESQAAWASLSGVYGYYDVKGPKPGATVYARFSDPESAIGDDLPIYFAGHFYGSGRVFYAGSGEMWRSREVDEIYLEQFYTKLVRHVSQGRLLRGSNQGVLLVERDRYLLGNTVLVRAQLQNAQHEPLDTPSVSLQVTQPDSTTQMLVLQADPSRKGMFSGQFTVLQEGVFRLDLPVPETIDQQLSRRIQVRVPELERDNPERNDPLLGEIAKTTGGLYYVGFEEAVGKDAAKPLVSQLRNQQETTTLSGAPNREFEYDVMRWTLAILTGLLCTEWLIRRLSKLA